MSELINNLSKISIRSSFLLEDQNKSSMAGEFDGLANVKNSKQNINNGIKKLIKQYKVKTKSKKPYIKWNIVSKLCRKLNFKWGSHKLLHKDGTDYYVINYDDTSSLTNTVTSEINWWKSNKYFKKILMGLDL